MAALHGGIIGEEAQGREDAVEDSISYPQSVHINSEAEPNQSCKNEWHHANHEEYLHLPRRNLIGSEFDDKSPDTPPEDGKQGMQQPLGPKAFFHQDTSHESLPAIIGRALERYARGPQLGGKV